MKRAARTFTAGVAVALALASTACSSGGDDDAGIAGGVDDPPAVNADDGDDAEAAGGTEVVTPSTTSVVESRPFAFVKTTESYVDGSRPTTDAEGNQLAPDRTLLTDLYVPQGAGPFPLVVFSHGAVGHPRKFTKLFGSWAEAGFVVAAPRFPLTSDEADPYVIGDVVNQPADVSFVMTQVLETVAVADADRAGVAGLSLGGATTYGVAYHDCCRDERIDAVIVMSGARLPFAGGEYDFSGSSFMLMHGTADPLIPFSEAESAFGTGPAPKYFVTLVDGSHAPPYEDTPSPHDEIVTQVSLAFWDTYLLGDAAQEPQITQAGDEPGISSIETG